MIRANKVINIIDEYLERCYTEPKTDIYANIEYVYNEIMDTYGWKDVTNVLEACSLQQDSDLQEEYYQSVRKIKKEILFAISSELSFLAGMAYAEIERSKNIES